MAEKAQTEANCNLENTNQIANEVGERREKEKEKSHIDYAKNFKNAIDRHERDLKISRDVGDRAREGRAYFTLGNAYHSLRDFPEAVECHKQDLKISKEVGDRAGEGRAR